MPHLHSGLTKARRYEGKYRAAKGSALKGTRGLYSARWLSRPNWVFVTRITPSALLARSARAQANTLTKSQMQHGQGQVRLDPTRTVEHQQKQPALASRTAKLSALVVLLVGSLVVPGASAEQNEGSTAFMLPLCKTWLKTAADG